MSYLYKYGKAFFCFAVINNFFVQFYFTPKLLTSHEGKICSSQLNSTLISLLKKWKIISQSATYRSFFLLLIKSPDLYRLTALGGTYNHVP